MSRVITYSRYFPAHHPRKGEPTFFVEKIQHSIDRYIPPTHVGLDVYLRGNRNLKQELLEIFLLSISVENYEPKHHTIRAGHRWKVGDKFSPRVWSGKPYQSKQIIIAPDIEIVKVWDFKIEKYKGGFWIDFGSYKISEWMQPEETILPLLARNDGLELQDMLAWFKFPSPFNGQVICWSNEVNY